MTTCAPSAASRWATARPMPLAAPVTRAMRRASSFSGGASVSLYSSSGQYSTSKASWAVERGVAAERPGRAEDRDGVVVDVGGDAGGAGVLADGEHAESAAPDDARRRVGSSAVPLSLRLEVGGVVDDEALPRACRPLQRVSGSAGRSTGDEHGSSLVLSVWSGVAGPTGRAPSAFARARRTPARRRVVEAQRPALRCRRRAAQVRGAAQRRRAAAPPAARRQRAPPNARLPAPRSAIASSARQSARSWRRRRRVTSRPR